MISSLAVGDYLKPEDVGKKNLPKFVRRELAERGLGTCSFTRKVYSSQDMRTNLLSYDGYQRAAMYYGAKYRAQRRGVHFDQDFMKMWLCGWLPCDFNGAPYSHRATGRGPSTWSLSVDRIRPEQGYIRSNVRFLPFWVNRSLLQFEDMKAHRICQRLLGLYTTVVVHPIPQTRYQDAKLVVRELRYSAGRRGIFVGPCMQFETLLEAGFFVDRCPYSGISLAFERNRGRGNLRHSPSFDRVDPRGAYTLDNVQLVSFAVNALKSNLLPADLAHFLSAIEFMQTTSFSATHMPEHAR